jgi:hypothetical protein
LVELIEGEDGYSLLDLDDTDNLVEEALDEYATNIEFPPAYLSDKRGLPLNRR